jgi:SMC interacting uncharacterized protein involved in chromosome segregation
MENDERELEALQSGDLGQQEHSGQQQESTEQFNELQAFREEMTCRLASMESRVASMESNIDDFWRIDRKSMRAWILGSEGCD